MNLINIRNLSKIYHTKEKETLAIKDISFDIQEGNIISIIGPSGCGKSTILNILTNLDNISSGTISINKPLTIGYMMQNDCLLPWLTSLNNATLGLKLRKKLNKKTKGYVISLLKKYNLYDFKDTYPSNLSGGMRQRLALIRTLAIHPNILLLDEPFSKLDKVSKELISTDVKNIINELSITTILITHDINEAIEFSDEIIVLSKSPSTVKNIHKIDTLTDKEKLYNTIWSEIEYV